MSTAIAEVLVGDQVRVSFGPFQGMTGEIVELNRTIHPTSVERALVKLSLSGRPIVIDFAVDALNAQAVRPR